MRATKKKEKKTTREDYFIKEERQKDILHSYRGISAEKIIHTTFSLSLFTGVSKTFNS